MLVDDIKKRLGAAIKARNDVETQVLRVALGEIQTLQARAARAATDDEAVQILRKLVKSNEETKAATNDEARRATLDQENAILRSLGPEGPSPEELLRHLGPVREAIEAAGNDGQATGIAIKHLKAQGIGAPGGDVATAVRALRASRSS